MTANAGGTKTSATAAFTSVHVLRVVRSAARLCRKRGNATVVTALIRPSTGVRANACARFQFPSVPGRPNLPSTQSGTVLLTNAPTDKTVYLTA